MSLRPVALVLSCVLLLLPGKTLLQAADPADAPPEVKVVRAVTREISDYETFVGRTEAAMKVDLRARVSGYLDKVDFKDGTDVKKGDVLFEIDPRPYQAELDRMETRLNLSVIRLKSSFAERDREGRGDSLDRRGWRKRLPSQGNAFLRGESNQHDRRYYPHDRNPAQREIGSSPRAVHPCSRATRVKPVEVAPEKEKK